MYHVRVFYINFFEAVDLACSYDGKYVFTAGGEDCTVNMWNVDTELVLAYSIGVVRSLKWGELLY